MRSPRAQVDERSFRIKYAELLNPAQLAAVTHRDGPMLVVAGAGSGKTRTLIYRVARLIESGVPPGAILLLTFTRRAAQEMLRRVEQLVGDRGARGRRRHLSFFRQPGAAPVRVARSGSSRISRFSTAPTWRTSSICCGRGWAWGRSDRRFPKKGTIAEAISMARNKRRDLERGDRVRFSASARASRTKSCALAADLRDVQARARTARLRRPALPAGRIARTARQRPPAPERHLSLRHDRRVPGHQPDPGRAGAAARRDPSQRDGGGRRRAVDLFVSRRQLPQHHGLPGDLRRARA